MKVQDLQNIDQNKVLLVDIREPQELAIEPSIPGAINIPMSRIIAEIENGNLPMNKKIVTVCRSGGRCFAVNSELDARGFDTDMLEGGMVAYNRFAQ
jgi:rhodanese-related sulfurtransferase